MPTWLADWLKEIWEIIRWRSVSNALDWLTDTLKWKAIVTTGIAMIAAAIGYIGNHPFLEHGATGGIATAILILVWDWVEKRKRPRITKDFMTFPAYMELGLPSVFVTDLQHHWRVAADA
jgi:hypothetical protein